MSREVAGPLYQLRQDSCPETHVRDQTHIKSQKRRFILRFLRWLKNLSINSEQCRSEPPGTMKGAFGVPLRCMFSLSRNSMVYFRLRSTDSPYQLNNLSTRARSSQEAFMNRAL